VRRPAGGARRPGVWAGLPCSCPPNGSLGSEGRVARGTDPRSADPGPSRPRKMTGRQRRGALTALSRAASTRRLGPRRSSFVRRNPRRLWPSRSIIPQTVDLNGHRSTPSTSCQGTIQGRPMIRGSSGRSAST
jgi:hypothetical protein